MLQSKTQLKLAEINFTSQFLYFNPISFCFLNNGSSIYVPELVSNNIFDMSASEEGIVAELKYILSLSKALSFNEASDLLDNPLHQDNHQSTLEKLKEKYNNKYFDSNQIKSCEIALFNDILKLFPLDLCEYEYVDNENEFHTMNSDDREGVVLDNFSELSSQEIVSTIKKAMSMCKSYKVIVATGEKFEINGS